VDEGGVREPFPKLGVDWFEEVPLARSRILNGHIYALEGLREAGEHLGLAGPLALHKEGLDALIAALPLYDCGFWSYYDYPSDRPLYVASYSYHWMHCILLSGLAENSAENSEEGSTLGQFAQRWKGYAGSLLCRLRASGRMARQKIRHYR
jgi:hypothetical protein